METRYPVVQETKEDALLNFIHETKAFDDYFGCNVFSIAFCYIKELEGNISHAIKFMEAHGYDKYDDTEPEFQMWRSLKNSVAQ